MCLCISTLIRRGGWLWGRHWGLAEKALRYLWELIMLESHGFSWRYYDETNICRRLWRQWGLVPRCRCDMYVQSLPKSLGETQIWAAWPASPTVLYRRIYWITQQPYTATAWNWIWAKYRYQRTGIQILKHIEEKLELEWNMKVYLAAHVPAHCCYYSWHPVRPASPQRLRYRLYHWF